MKPKEEKWWKNSLKGGLDSEGTENSAAISDKEEQAGPPPEGGSQYHRIQRGTEKLQDLIGISQGEARKLAM